MNTFVGVDLNTRFLVCGLINHPVNKPHTWRIQLERSDDWHHDLTTNARRFVVPPNTHVAFEEPWGRNVKFAKQMNQLIGALAANTTSCSFWAANEWRRRIGTPSPGRKLSGHDHVEHLLNLPPNHAYTSDELDAFGLALAAHSVHQETLNHPHPNPQPEVDA